MRRLTTLTAGILAVMCWLVTPGFSATGSTAKAVARIEHSYSGKIIMVDPKLRILIVKGKNGEETFHPDRYSTFTINGEPKLFADLHKGEVVTVTHKEPAKTKAVAHAGNH